MTHPTAFSGHAPQTLAYHPPSATALRHPRSAVAGFLLCAFFFLAEPAAYSLRYFFDPDALFLPYLLINLAVQSMLVVGAGLVLRAFRGSAVVPLFLRVLLLLATLCFAAASVLTTGWYFVMQVNVPHIGNALDVLFSLAFRLSDFTLPVWTLLWLLLVWHMGRMLGSWPVRLVTLMLLVMRCALIGAFMLISLSQQFTLAAGVPPFWLKIISYRLYASFYFDRILSPLPMCLLALWCAARVWRLAGKTPHFAN